MSEKVQFKRVRKTALKTASAFLGNTVILGSDYESIAQDVVLQFLLKGAEVRDVDRWTTRVTRNMIASLLRRKYSSQMYSMQLYFQTQSCISNHPERESELYDDLQSAISNLTDEDQSYIRLRYLLNVPTSELSEHIGKERKPGRHNQVLSRARNRLRSELEKISS